MQAFFLVLFGISSIGSSSVSPPPFIVPTDGYGCGGFLSSFQREPIPESSLSTGVFYIIRLQRKNGSEPQGYLTYQSEAHPIIGHRYVFADSHHDMAHYADTGIWYWDSQWAFLKTETPGWYHWINCGYPSYFATWSNWEEENDGTGKYPFVLDMNYPGNHSTDDFLFKPVKVGKTLYRILTKSFGGGTVSESNKTYSKESNYMQIESTLKGFNSHDIRGLFIFEEDKRIQNIEYSSSGRIDRSTQQDNTCSCWRNVLMAMLVTISVIVLGTVLWIQNTYRFPVKV